MKYYIARIKEQNGEQEYTQEHLFDLRDRQKPEVYLRYFIKNWYDDFTGYFDTDKTIAEFGYGERLAELRGYVEIPKEHYDILKLYI